MIRPWQNSDLNAICRLWQTCFGDDAAFVLDFIRHFSPYGLVYDEHGTPVAQLFLLPVECFTQNRWQHVWYVYACATNPAYRRRGLMRALLNAAYTQMADYNVVGLVLVPASNHLFDYYAQCDFQLFSVMQTDTFTSRPCNEIEFTNLTIHQIEELRNHFYGNSCIRLSTTYLQFAIQMAQVENGGLITFVLDGCKGYALCRATENGIQVEEWVCTASNATQRIADLCGTYFNVPVVQVCSAAHHDTPTARPFAMIRGLHADPTSYFNLALD